MSGDALNKARKEYWDVVAELPANETLRDRFAMAALTGLLAASLNRVSPDAWAKTAYLFADAMMEARK